MIIMEINGMGDEKLKDSLLNLSFPIDFFNDEIREGFYVPEMMKRFWAAQLKVLSEIVKICVQHDIPWFADYGSLIGAVRHGGYIPWDDDFDICMLRHDYEKFIKYAKNELPEGFLSLDVRDIEDSDNLLGRIVNWNVVPSDNDKLKSYFDCPYGVGVDIFVLDGVSDDPEKEEKRREIASEIGLAIAMINDGKKDTPECRKVLANIERENHIVLHRKKDLKRQLNLLTLEVYQKFSPETCKNVTFMPIWVKDHTQLFPKAFFENTIWAKFETTEIKIPVLSEEMLKNVYGDYMKIYRAGGAHDYPVYGGQEETLKEAFGGKNPGRYTFLEEILTSVIGSCQESDSQKSSGNKIDFSSYCTEIVNLMKTVKAQMQDLFASEDYSTLYQVLESCQSVAIALGNEIEKRVRNSEVIIGLLEKYCENAYICHEKLAEGTLTSGELDEIGNLVSDIDVVLSDIILSRKKQVLFLPCSPKWWDAMEDIYLDRIADDHYECTVAPIPCYQKNLDGEIVGVLEDEIKYPEYIKSLSNGKAEDTVCHRKSWDDIDLEKTYFDEIVIQFPFDGWNRSMTIPPQFCSDELAKHTDKLTYSPCLVPVFPDGGDPKLYQSLKTLVEQPTVIYSDTVILHSEQEKEAYRSISNELTGGKYTEYWNNKFFIVEHNKDDNSLIKNVEKNKYAAKERKCADLKLPTDFSGKKILLYHIGISSLFQYKEHAISRLEETVSDIIVHEDRLRCIFSPNPNINEIERVDGVLWEEYKNFEKSLIDKEKIFVDKSGDALKYIDIIDGYYGDGDEVAHRCRNTGIPVMIRKAD